MYFTSIHFTTALPADGAILLSCSYSKILVLLSFLVASAAAFTALDMAERVSTAQRLRGRALWRWIGAFCMGGGIWSMHFVGMLAFEVPVAVRYDFSVTLLSLCIAVLASRLAMAIISLPTLSRRQYLLSGLLIGFGIAAMHYSGMAALRSVAQQYYDPWRVALSVAIAIAASWIALLLAVYFRGRNARADRLLKYAAALTMGGAIVAMHFTGMAALNLVVPADTVLVLHPASQNLQLGLFIGLVALLIIAAGIGAAYADKHIEQKDDALREANARVHELAQSHSALREFAHSDVLTGLNNRRALSHLFAHRAAGCARLAVLLLDLDRFKQINDTLGHGAGDELLKIVAERIRQSSRENDVVARLGGDEFCMLAALHQHEEARLVAQRLLYRMREPIVLAGRTLHVGASIGISLYPEDGADIDTLLRHADLALYQSKGSGRDRACFFNAELKARVELEQQLEAELRAALDQAQLTLRYQPVLQLCGDCAEKLAVVVCWLHPERGLLWPEQFLFAAHSRGLMDDIDGFVIERVCQDLLRLRRDGFSQVHIEMSCPAHSLFDDAFPEELSRTLRRRGLDPETLELTIPESALADNEMIAGVLARLSRSGFHLTLDGYGAGPTSLTQLLQLPFDAVKIDRALIAGLPGGARERTIVAAVIAMARNFKLRVLADGVNTQAQRLFLMEHGCDHIQGECVAGFAPLDQLLPRLTPCAASTTRRRLHSVPS